MRAALILGYGWLATPLVIVGLIIWISTRHGADERLIFWVSMFLVTVFGFTGWFKSRRFLKTRPKIPEGALADGNVVFYETTSWKNVARFSIVSLKPSRYRLQIQGMPSYRPRVVDVTGNVADAEIEFADAKAEPLRRLLYAWIDESKNDEAYGRMEIDRQRPQF